MDISSQLQKLTGNSTLPGRKAVLLLVLLTTVLVVAMVALLPQAIDWSTAYRPAALELLSGRSPYRESGYFNAPWALVPLAPFALLPEHIGRALLAVIGLAVYALIAVRLGAGPITVAVLLLSPPVLHGLLNGSIDWLALSGVIMPAQIGLFFISIKPQIGIAVSVFWFVEAWRNGGGREVLRVFGPFVLALGLSFVIFGLWPLRFGREIDLWWNASLWPASIPVGMLLLTAAIRTRRIEYSMAASPCFSPYVLLHSWVGALFALSSSLVYSVVAVIGLWIVVILRALGV